MTNNTSTLRKWATPLTIGSFVVVGITGVLMFFHLEFGLIKPAHEWLSWLLVLGGIAHVIINWKAVLNYMTKPAAKVIIIFMLSLGALSFLPLGGEEGGKKQLMKAVGALEQSQLTLVAQVAKTTPETLVEKLKAKGIEVKNSDQTIQEIADANGKKPTDIIGQLF
jgi:hypothetical protein